MLASHRNTRENGDVLHTILTVAVFVIMVAMLLGALMQFVTNKGTSIEADNFRTVVSQAETWSVANPSDANAYISGNMTYSELVNIVANDKLGEVSDGMKNSKVQYLEKENGEYTACVENTNETKAELSTYVYNTEIDGVTLEESCK